MKESAGREITLSIETTIGGGSLAIIKNKKPIAVWTGERQISKAEDLLERIADLLDSNNIGKAQIKEICVSQGIGSLTGEKIGLAIAKGLCRAFGCRTIKLSILDALLSELPEDFEGQAVTAVLNGKDRIFWQRHQKKENLFFDVTKPSRTTDAEFRNILNSSENRQFIIFQNGENGDFSDDSLLITENKRITVVKGNLAAVMAIDNNSFDKEK